MIEEHVVDGGHEIVLDNCLLVDCFIHSRPTDYYERFRGKNAWLFHLSDETYEGGYDAYSSFRGVFRNYWSGSFSRPRVMQLPLGYTAGLNRRAANLGTAQRRYLWSFLGAAQKTSRPEMIRALLPLGPKFTHITDSGPDVRSLGRDEYQQILRDSVFVPAPMGNVNLDSFRLYEALELGAIPLLEKRIGLDYFARLLGEHPLPAFGNWNQAAEFIRTVRGDRQTLDELQKECVGWWTSYKERLRERIRSFLLLEPEQGRRSYVSPWQSVPGWQYAQLLRHHSLPAVSRRIRRQVQRLGKRGRFRETQGRA